MVDADGNPLGSLSVDAIARVAHGEQAVIVTVLAQLKIRGNEDAGPSCVEDNGFCPSWIADNLDRYKHAPDRSTSS